MTDSDRPENTEPPAGPVTREVQARIEIADRTRELNGFTVRDDRAALARAREIDTDPSVCSEGALRGWIGVVKDNIHVAGLVNSAGSPGLQNFVPTEDAPAVAAVREAGAILLGKANMHELAFGGTSNNPTYGPVRNPYDHSRSVGGSSGGTAALVASGAARFGLGTDTGGSVRIPASLAGLYGLRPTTGRYSGHGVTPISPSRDTVGAMASILADLDVVDRVLAPGDASRSEPAHEVRLGVPTSGHTEVQVAARAGRDRIRDVYAHAFESARIDAILTPTTPVGTDRQLFAVATVLDDALER